MKSKEYISLKFSRNLKLQKQMSSSKTEVKASGIRKQKKRVEKLEGKPKKPQSSFFIFLNKSRESWKKLHPGLDCKQIASHLSEQWKSMTEQQKEEYNKLAEEERAKYEIQMKAFHESDAFKSYQEKKEKMSPPKKPMTAFFFFLGTRREVISKQTPTKKIGEISTLVSEEWKKLDANEKSLYETQAKNAKEEYTKQMEVFKKNNPEWKHKTAVDSILSNKKKSKKENKEGSTQEQEEWKISKKQKKVIDVAKELKKSSEEKLKLAKDNLPKKAGRPKKKAEEKAFKKQAEEKEINNKKIEEIPKKKRISKKAN